MKAIAYTYTCDIEVSMNFFSIKIVFVTMLKVSTDIFFQHVVITRGHKVSLVVLPVQLFIKCIPVFGRERATLD